MIVIAGFLNLILVAFAPQFLPPYSAMPLSSPVFARTPLALSASPSPSAPCRLLLVPDLGLYDTTPYHNRYRLQSVADESIPDLQRLLQLETSSLGVDLAGLQHVLCQEVS